jgi:hypothetical protein
LIEYWDGRVRGVRGYAANSDRRRCDGGRTAVRQNDYTSNNAMDGLGTQDIAEEYHAVAVEM